MAEYINKAELMNERPEWLNTNMLSKEKSAHNNGWNDCNDEWLNIITEIPTIDIVHCKDCKYAEVADMNDHEDGYTCQHIGNNIWFSGSYCSWGERKKERKWD